MSESRSISSLIWPVIGSVEARPVHGARTTTLVLPIVSLRCRIPPGNDVHPAPNARGTPPWVSRRPLRGECARHIHVPAKCPGRPGTPGSKWPLGRQQRSITRRSNVSAGDAKGKTGHTPNSANSGSYMPKTSGLNESFTQPATDSELHSVNIDSRDTIGSGPVRPPEMRNP
jgi:hypothetical protein